jgi:hypothetical protein
MDRASRALAGPPPLAGVRDRGSARRGETARRRRTLPCGECAHRRGDSRRRRHPLWPHDCSLDLAVTGLEGGGERTKIKGKKGVCHGLGHRRSSLPSSVDCRPRVLLRPTPSSTVVTTARVKRRGKREKGRSRPRPRHRSLPRSADRRPWRSACRRRYALRRMRGRKKGARVCGGTASAAGFVRARSADDRPMQIATDRRPVAAGGRRPDLAQEASRCGPKSWPARWLLGCRTRRAQGRWPWATLLYGPATSNEQYCL